ncbi:RNA polymerase II transcription factor B subunit 1 [Lecanora helva]
MAPLRGSAAYKKKDGILSISKDSKSISWTPVAPPGSQPALTLPISSITRNQDLQQTPATSAKVMLKVFAQAPGTSTSDTHVFTFTSATAARAEADVIKDALSNAIQSSKAGGSLPTAPGGGGSSAAMAIAGAVFSTPGGGKDPSSWYDDERLKQDPELTLSLLKANPSLKKTFSEAQKTKPSSITASQFASQFWSSRVHLLRAHAIEKSQTRGAYNVLSAVRRYTEDNQDKMQIGKDQIQLIFKQHSLVKRAYDENVPKLSEKEFWGRFFRSRLFKKLKGEKVQESDALDNVLDKYLQDDENDAERARRAMAAHIPHIIDVEGNEENHSQRKGNRPDHTMRPNFSDKVPLYRSLNALSEKILSQVAPNDVDPSLPIGMDEETFNSLALRDLQGDTEENRVILNIKDQSRFFNSDKDSGTSAEASTFAKQNPAKMLKSLQADLSHLDGHTNLETAIGVNDDSDSSDDEANPKKGHVGSKASLKAATSQILKAISEQRARTDDLSTSNSQFSTVQTSSTSGLSSGIYESLSICHATTIEFLQHFWSLFLSGDPDRANEIAYKFESLGRAKERIEAITEEAEAERQAAINKIKKQAQEYFERTGKRRKYDYDTVLGGTKAVNQLLGPTIKAIELAEKEYKKALKEQTRDVN